jgi:hypothetical protein
MTITIGMAPASATLFLKSATISLIGLLAFQGAANAQFNLISQERVVSVSSNGSGVTLLPTGGGTRMTSWGEQDAASSSVAGPFSASLSERGSTLSYRGQASASLDSMVASNAITAAGAFQVEAESSGDPAYRPYGSAESKSSTAVKLSFNVNEPTDVLLAGSASSAVSRTQNGYAPDGKIMYYLTGTGAVSFALTGPDTNLSWRTGRNAGDVYGGEISPLSRQLRLNPGVYDLVISASASADPLPYANGREIYGSGRGSFDFSLSAVPESSSAWLMGLGLLGVAVVARARQARA